MAWLWRPLSGPQRRGFPADGITSALIYLMRRLPGTGQLNRLDVAGLFRFFFQRSLNSQDGEVRSQLYSSLIYCETPFLESFDEGDRLFLRLSMKLSDPLGIFSSFLQGHTAAFRFRHARFRVRRTTFSNNFCPLFPISKRAISYGQM